MKKYYSYKDSGVEWIGEIPEHWEVKPLKYLVKCNSEALTEKTNPEMEINYIEIGDVSAFDGIKETSLYTFEKAPSRARRIVREGDVIISTVRTYLKAITSIPLNFDGYIASTGFAVLTPKLIHSGFLGNIALNEGLIGEIISLSKGVSYPSITAQDLTNISIPFPSVEEQDAIANYLDHKTTQIDHLIAKKEQFIQLLEEERVAVINQAVTKGLDPKVPMKDSGIEWLVEIPEHWEVKKLKQIFNSSKGLTITKENLESEGIPCVNYGEIHSKFGFEVDIDKHQLKCVNPTYLESDYKSLIQTGDFVFADTSEDIVGAGNFTYLKSNHEIFAGYHTVILRALENIESRFFAYQFDSIPFRTQIRQSVKGIKVFSITQGILKNTNLWIPPLDEQRQIIEFLDIETERIVSLKNSTRKEIELLKEYKTSLISEVVTGKVDVRNEKMN
jgi:type I restriction enzyme S subunit